MMNLLSPTLTLILCLSFCFSGIAQENCLVFDGVDDFVSVSHQSKLSPATKLTVEAWINASQWKSQQWEGTIVGKDIDPQQGYVLRTGSNGKLSFTVGGGNGQWPEAVSASIMQTNTWYHIAGVYDNGNMTIYINGNPVGSASATQMVTSTSPLYIGASSGFGGRFFAGKIDEVRIWNVARTQTQIQENANLAMTGTESGLVAYYSFNEISGNSAPNTVASTSNSTGSLQGFSGNPWVPGFVTLGTDIRTERVISPDAITFFNQGTRVRALFQNTGIDTITSLQVGYQLNTRPIITETVAVTLYPGDRYEHAFDALIDLPRPTNDLRVFAQAGGDTNPDNDELNLPYNRPDDGDIYTIPVFIDKQHNFAGAGQAALTTVQLPDNNFRFEQILMHVSLDCPSGGCDPWDQPAKISAIKDDKSHELGRFITPYGKACGPWTIDVTDFKSVLQGGVSIESYIQVWGGSGWLLNVSLEFIPGSPAFPYQKLTPLWATDNWVYGDPGIPDDLPAYTLPITAQTLESHLRMTVTGHGQANTDNAAEFSPKTHTLVVNGTSNTAHSLWKADCAQNPCSNQFGTWTFARAGWCPGQSVEPFRVNLSNDAVPGQDVSLDYELQAYTNFLNTGYNGGSHTEPHYKIHAFVVEKSEQYIDSSFFINMITDEVVFPVEVSDLGPDTEIKARIINGGTEIISQPILRYYLDGVEMAEETVTATLNPGDTLDYTFSTLANLNGLGYSISVMVDVADDGASSDDVATVRIGTITDVDAPLQLQNIRMFPNPSEDAFTLLGEGSYSGTFQLRIVDIMGKAVQSMQISAAELTTGYEVRHDFPAGTYVVSLLSESGWFSQRMIVR